MTAPPMQNQAPRPTPMQRGRKFHCPCGTPWLSRISLPTRNDGSPRLQGGTFPPEAFNPEIQFGTVDAFSLQLAGAGDGGAAESDARFGREFVYIVRTILCCCIDEPQPPASGPITWRTPEAIVVIECCSMQLERLHLVIEP
jgi:hypothetical protein